MKTTVSFPFASILGLIFITLKLTGYITWPWLWVLSPFWIGLALAVFFGGLVLACAAWVKKAGGAFIVAGLSLAAMSVIVVSCVVQTAG